MLRLDKDFIARQLVELTSKCERAEQKLEKKTLKVLSFPAFLVQK